MALTVRVRNLNPGDSISNLRVGAYLPGGQQISLFSENGVEWTTGYGYSNPFELTADDAGNASKTILFQIDETVTGDANIRVKMGSGNVFTEAILVAE